MTDFMLRAKLDRIGELAHRRAFDEFREAAEAAALEAVTGGLPAKTGAIKARPTSGDFASPVDVHALLREFLHLPQEGDLRRAVGDIVRARSRHAEASFGLGNNLLPNAADWTDADGDAFNKHCTRLALAAELHAALLRDLEILYGTYASLVNAARSAAHDLADKTISALQQDEPRLKVDVMALIGLTVAGASVVGAFAFPATGAVATVTVLTRVGSMGSMLTAHNVALGAITVSGTTTREIMQAFRDGAETLQFAVRQKGKVIADILQDVPHALSADLGRLVPPLPAP